jgi:hypothetical protein
MAAEQSRDLWLLLDELERLVAAEQSLSAVRRRLHTQLDVGVPNDVTRRRERQVSDERLELHRRIDALRAELAPLLSEPLVPLAERRRLLRLGV